MMVRCDQCHATFNLIGSVILWLCPVCGEYGAVKSFAQDTRYPVRYSPSSSEYELVIG